MNWILLFAAIVLCVFLFIKYQRLKLKKYVKKLFSTSPPILHKSFKYSDIENLPTPVKKYFKLVLTEGQPYISYARLKHKGFFRTSPNSKWTKISGQEYFTSIKPGFLWQGKTRLFRALDMFIDCKGKLEVYLFSLIKIITSEGEETDKGELLRWLAETAIFPTALLSNDYISWEHINHTSAQLCLQYENFQLQCNVLFNEAGEIYQIETDRFYLNDKTIHKWIGNFSDYKRFANILIPTTLEVSWILPQGKFTYVKFNITEIEFNKPELY